MKNISTETIGTVIRCMQDNQPPMSQDTAIQMQLVSGMLQNPDSLMKLAELCEKLPNGKKEPMRKKQGLRKPAFRGRRPRSLFILPRRAGF